MIEVRSPLQVEADPQGGWQLTFWVCNDFDYTTPSRAMLAEITDALGQDVERNLQLPAYEAGEDFIEGVLQFGAVPLRVYFEHSLSYLALMSDDESALHDVASRIQHRVVVS